MKKRLKFKSADFAEQTCELRNPSRGWYRIYSFCADVEPDFEELRWCLNEEETCALVIIDIAAYRSCELSGDALLRIKRILSFFDANKKDIILRIVYDREGKGAEHEPSQFSRVIGHIGQLEPVFQEFRQRIVFYEGLLVGSWGEMHGSKFLGKEKMIELNAALSRSASGIIRAVRSPAQWRKLFGEISDSGIGLFNDAIFGSDTDLGTFAPAGSDSFNWEEPWPKARELEFESKLSAFAPQCGEAVFGGDCCDYTLDEAADRLGKMGVSWLNCTYDEKILNSWKTLIWSGRGVWQGINGYDYIGRHLGYRFCLRGSSAHIGKDFCDISVTVENTGFSGFYQEADVRIKIDGKTEIKEYLTDWDLRKLKYGQKQTLTWRLPLSEGRLYLSVKRKWDGEVIRFANASDGDGKIILGDLL